MKTAILVFGEYREFNNAHKTWKFLNNIDYDLYVSTWNTSNDVNDLLGINLHTTIDETDILNAVEKQATINTINSKEKNEMIEALKQESRKIAPTSIKSTCLL